MKTHSRWFMVLSLLTVSVFLTACATGGPLTPLPDELPGESPQEEDGLTTPTMPAEEGGETSAEVVISDAAFQPGQITVQTGTTVTWRNEDSVPHTVTADGPAETAGLFDTGEIESGETAALTFEEPGTYTYVCSLHPEMTGTVLVQ